MLQKKGGGKGTVVPRRANLPIAVGSQSSLKLTWALNKFKFCLESSLHGAIFNTCVRMYAFELHSEK